MKPSLPLALAAILASPSLRADESIRLLTDFALAPDGKALVFAWADDVWTASSEGGPARRLTFDPAGDRTPRVAPDGKTIAFTSNRSGSWQVWTMPREGGSAKQHTFHSEGYSIEEYRPGGESLLCRGSRDHYWRAAQRFIEVDLGARSADRILFDDYGDDGAWSPDGRKLLFVREGVDWWRKGYRGSDAAQIWSYDRATGAFTDLLKGERGARVPLWKPDGAGFYYLSEQDGAWNLWERDLASATSRQLTDYEDDGVVFAAAARDGSTLVFRRQLDLWLLHPGSGEPPRRIDLVNAGEPLRENVTRRFLSSAESASYSPDGLEVAFIAGGDLWVMDTELREPVQVTRTPEPERQAVFSPDGKAIFFAADQHEQSDVWRVERADEAQYWWRSREFVFRRLTQDTEIEQDLRVSPDGTRLSFVRGRGDLMTTDLEGRDARRLVSAFAPPDYDWSPDGKWITYSAPDDNFNNDVWIVPADGSAPAFNVSVHPDNEGNPRWSPDGKILAFAGRRADREVDVHWTWLKKDDDDQDSRDRKLKKALEKMEKERKEKAAKGKDEPKEKAEKPPEKKDEPAKAEGDKPEEKPDAKDEKEKKEEKKPELPKVEIDFDDLRDRIRTIRIADSDEDDLLWLDEKKLAFTATVDGKRGVHTVEFPEELTPKFLAQRGVSRPLRSAKAKLWGGVSGGQPSTIDAQGKIANHGFQAPQEVDLAARNRVAFLEAWRQLRDHFYDERLGNRNWDAIRRKYQEAAEQAFDVSQLQQVVQLMLGELNGSHLGFNAQGGGAGSGLAFVDVTAHLGLRFEPGDPYKGPGWKVSFVWSKGPCAENGSRVAIGDVVVAIDGNAVDPSLDPTLLLNGPLARDVRLRVLSDGVQRDVVVRPISYGAARSMLYEEWIEANRKAVETKSGGKLGYMHVAGMDWPSFLRFDAELYKIGYGRDGLVIDVRGNGGGSTADHLLTALTQPRHAITVPRGGAPGYPQDRVVYASWWKPIVVLCDQNSFSNAEIFAHAIKTLKRGHLVGVPTAGGVISTGGTGILDVGFLRLPFRGWFLPDSGEDMELNGARPDYVVWPKPGDLPAGKDEQLDKAIEVLQADVQEFAQRPQPSLRKSSERLAGE